MHEEDVRCLALGTMKSEWDRASPHFVWHSVISPDRYQTFFQALSSSQFCEAFTSPPLSARLPPRVLGSAEQSTDVIHSWGLL